MMRLIITLVFLFSISFASAQNKTKRSTDYTASIKRGTIIYEDFCVNCHMTNGEGVAKAFPPLAKSDFLIKNRLLSIKAVKFGQKGKIVVNGIEYNSNMAPMGLTDQEVADVMNYITNSWGNTNDKMITTEEVSKVKQ